MAADNPTRQDEDFKKSLVSLHQNGKTQTRLCRDCGVSRSAPGRRVRPYSAVERDDGNVPTASQVRDL